MNNLLSYLWPQTRKIDSDFNGILELTLVNGRKVLNSKNANYSFGSLQRILEIGLSKIELKEVHSVLLLGLGGGSVISSLRKKDDFKGEVLAVEIDKKVIEIAAKEFSISDAEDLTIKNVDAYGFTKECKSKYDLIIVDLFIDNKVPEQFYSEEFCTNLSLILDEKGSILFNLGMGHMNNKMRDFVKHHFNNTLGLNTFLLDNVLNTNTLLIANKLP